MEAPGVAFALEGANLQLATISAPLASAFAAPVAGLVASKPSAGKCSQPDSPDWLPPPLPTGFAALAAALAAVRAAATSALPFAAYVADADSLRVVCQRARVADVFKLLRGQQATLGISIKDVKSHISLAPPAGEELARVCAAGVAAALQRRGWWQMDEERLLGASPLEPAADGRPQAAASVRLRVHAAVAADPKEPPTLQLLVLPEQVEFRHPACRPGTSMQERSAWLAGTLCSLLPDLRPALIQRLRPADPATLARLRPVWAAHGQPLPAEAEGQGLVEVSLDCDPDAPSYPYPACRVLGQDGLHSVASKRSTPAVQAALAKLRDDLAASPFKLLGKGLRLGATAHEWFPEGLPLPRGRLLAAAAAEQAPALVFVTARQHEQQAKRLQAQAERGPALGKPIDIASFRAVEAAGAAGAGQQRQRKQYAPVDPKLQAAFEEAKRLQAEAERPAGVAARPAGLAVAATATAASASAAPAGAASSSKPVPLALRQAAQAAGGSSQKPTVPTFKKVGAAAVPGAAPNKAAPGLKRVAGAKPPAGPKAPKRPKAASAALAAAPAMVALGTAMAAEPSVPGSAPASAAAPPSATKPAAGRAKLDASAAEGGGMCAAAAAATAGAAPPKAPAKPRAKAADIDISAVKAKVQQMHAAGGLGKLTIPEMKAYLKSIKQPVGGKKGALEERVRQSLGGGAAQAAAAGTASVVA